VELIDMGKDQNRDTSDRGEQNQNPPNLRPDSACQEKLADVCARFADICDYFSRQNLDMPPDVLEEIGRVSKLSISDRIAAMDQLNHDLVEYLHTVSQDSGMRH
jgi:hypothetical protein